MCKKKLPAKESPEMRKQRVNANVPQRPKSFGKADLTPAALRRKEKKELKDLH